MKKLSIIVLIMMAAVLLFSGSVFSQMPDFGTITGTVTNQDSGEPIASAMVKAFRANSPHWPAGHAVTDEAGNYTLDVPYGDYKVSAEKFGFQLEWWQEVPDIENATVVTVGDGSNPEGINFTLAAIANDFGTLAGMVTNAGSGDPIANAMVTLRRVDDYHFHRMANSGEDGNYIFNDVPPGTYNVECFKMGFLPAQYPEPVVVNGDDITGIDFALQELVFGSISGAVTDAATNEPIGGARVIAQAGGNHPAHFDAITAEDGTYTIGELPPNVYEVHAFKEGYLPQDYADSIVINGNDVTDINFALEALVFGGIAGVVTDAGTADPIAGAMVVAISSDHPYHHRWAMTNDNGEYSMELLAGEYNLEAHARNYESYSSEEPIMVGDEIVEGVDIALTPLDLGSISGTVYSDADAPIPDATIEAYMRHGWFHMRTHSDADGNYMFEDVYPGSYAVRAFAPSFRSQVYDSVVVVENGADVTGIDFHLVPYDNENNDGYISGVVTDDSTGNPIAGAMLVAMTTQGGHWRWIRRAHTNDDGQYAFSNLPEIPFKIMCIAFGYRGEFYNNQTSWHDADPVTPDAENIDFGLTAREYGPRILSGRVSESSQPVDGAVVMAILDGNIVDVTSSYPDGYYYFEDMNPGDYTVDVVGPSENEASIEISVVLNDCYDADIVLSPTAVDNGVNPLPVSTTLMQNYPNPFNATTNIRFYLASESEAELSIYDLLGRKVSTLVSGTLAAGSHTFTWSGLDNQGQPVSSGMYLYILKTTDNTYSNRMLLLK